MKKAFKWIVVLAIIVIAGMWLFGDDTSSDPKVFTKGAVREKQVNLKGNGKDKVTVLVYMNGSDLETDDEEATTDITEMIQATDNENVNVVIQTMGTKQWASDYGISSKKSQRYEIDGDKLKLVDNSLPQLDCTDPKTLVDFIKWGAKTYPADRYILVFWNHGGGPVYGYGFDQWVEDETASLTIDEIQSALKEGGVYFDFIGMDCCLMSSLEVCCALSDYCDYMILSEDFESGLGWSYTNWLSKLAKNPSIKTEDLGKIIIDDTVAANDEGSTLAMLDESYMKVLYTAWTKFAYANEDKLMGKNYSQKVKKTDRAMPKLKEKGFFSDWLGSLLGSDDYTMEDYYVTDIMAVASNIDSEESKALESALGYAIVYYTSTDDEEGMTGVSVTLPYGDSDFYSELKRIFTNCGFDSEYVAWLKGFVSSDGYDDFYEYDEWYEDEWNGWDDFDDDYDWDDEWYWEDDYDDDYGWSNWFYDDDDDRYSWEYDDYDDYYFYNDYYDDYYCDDYDYDDDYYYYDDDRYPWWW